MDKKVVVQILRAPIGGIRKHVYDILTTLPQDAFEHIFITNMDDADFALPPIPNVTIFSLNIQDQPSPRDLKNLFVIYKYLSGKKIDIVHGHGAKGGLYARLVSYFIRAKCIYTPHGGSLHRVHGKLKNFIYDAVEIGLIPFTDTFLFESGYSRNIFSMNIIDVGGKAIVNYNGIELPKACSQNHYLPGQTIRMASFGLLRNLKGHDIAIRACSLLQKQNIPFTYVVYGKGEDHQILIQLISDLNLQKQVTILDYTNDVPCEMLKYDLILHPSRFESFGYVPVEAMALKIPVVVSAEGGLKEVVDPKTGFVASSNQPEEYFEIIFAIYCGVNTLEDKVDEAYRKVVNNFTCEKMIKKIGEVYHGEN
ncbi:MAG TPA: glycosyltransferase [Bacteriovoracaceae bacterium]|nr:glycosyltransferase [Bacteriovoracaceae bacterium]